MIATRFNPLGKMPPTPSMRYSQDGLVLQLDGIENVGRGRHDADSTKWVDLISGRKFSNRANAVTPIVFDNNYCQISGSNYSYLECPNCADIQDVFASGVFTLELCSYNLYYPRLMIKNFGVMFRNNATPNVYIPSPYTPNTNLNGSLGTQSVVVNNGSVIGYKNGSRMTYYQGGGQGIIFDDDTLRLGLGGYTSQAMFLQGYSIRLYNRAFTFDEIEYHRSIDFERFNIVL